MPSSTQTSKVKRVREISEGPNAEYKRRFALFVASTDQKQRQTETILKLIRPLKRKDDFLDVGAGSGEITAPVSERFKRTTVIEPNAEQVTRLSRQFPQFRIFPEPFERVDLGKDRFDLILCSHVLYYIPEKRWAAVTDKMVSRLRPGGKLIMVLQSPVGGVPDFFRKFTGTQVNSVRLWADLVTAYGQDRVRAYYGVSNIRTRSVEDMTDIGLFLLLDPKYRSRRAEVRRYFETYHRTGDGYGIRQEYITFVVDSRSLRDSSVRRS